MTGMIVNWSGPIYTFTDTQENPDPSTQLKFPIDAVYIKVNYMSGRMEIADIIRDIRPGAGTTRHPRQTSQLLLLVKQGAAAGMRIGDSVVAQELPGKIHVPLPR